MEPHLAVFGTILPAFAHSLTHDGLSTSFSAMPHFDLFARPVTECAPVSSGFNQLLSRDCLTFSGLEGLADVDTTFVGDSTLNARAAELINQTLDFSLVIIINDI